jgi:hypothetical protein
MSIIDRLRNRSAGDVAEDVGSQEPPSADEAGLPIPRYDRLDAKEVTRQLSQLTQVELAAIETYERDHGERTIVLNKLRYMLTREPLPDYDNLEVGQIVEALEGADGQTLKAVRDYERKFSRRSGVKAEIERALPTAKQSVGEAQAQQARAERVRTKAGA